MSVSLQPLRLSLMYGHPLFIYTNWVLPSPLTPLSPSQQGSNQLHMEENQIYASADEGKACLPLPLTSLLLHQIDFCPPLHFYPFNTLLSLSSVQLSTHLQFELVIYILSIIV